MRDRYFGRDGKPITPEDFIALYETPGARNIDRTDVSDDVLVSTVHLVRDHRLLDSDGPPLIFETMVFGGEHDQWSRWHATEADARTVHAAAVAWVRGEGPEPS